MSETPKDDADKARFCGKKGRSGPPTGNTNAARHYMRAGKLAPKLMYIERRCNGLGRHLHDATEAAKGEVNVVDAACINSAIKWERHGLLAQHWLRKEGENLTASERLKFSEAIAKASDNRDKNIRALGLDMKHDPWAVIDAAPAQPTETESNDEH